jgi:hypothetical protein
MTVVKSIDERLVTVCGLRYRLSIAKNIPAKFAAAESPQRLRALQVETMIEYLTQLSDFKSVGHCHAQISNRRDMG